MTKIKDLSGQKFNALTVVSIGRDSGNRIVWNCMCDCGGGAKVRGDDLKNGKTQSCGCRQKQIASSTFKKHDMAGTRTYRIWNNMTQRCGNPKAHSYENYGGRGIAVCDRWRNSFDAFLSDMGVCPEGMSIDRVNVDGNYGPSNCRWATDIEQLNNTRRNRFITHNGETLTMAQWSGRLGGSRETVKHRLQDGWSEERAVTTPIRLTLPKLEAPQVESR